MKKNVERHVFKHRAQLVPSTPNDTDTDSNNQSQFNRINAISPGKKAKKTIPYGP